MMRRRRRRYLSAARISGWATRAPPEHISIWRWLRCRKPANPISSGLPETLWTNLHDLVNADLGGEGWEAVTSAATEAFITASVTTTRRARRGTTRTPIRFLPATSG